MILIYRGSLPAVGSNKRTKEKHEIRRCFHSQIARAVKKPYWELFKNSPDFEGRTVGQFKFRPLICGDPFYPPRLPAGNPRPISRSIRVDYTKRRSRQSFENSFRRLVYLRTISFPPLRYRKRMKIRSGFCFQTIE